MNLLSVFIGGGLGACLRYILSSAALKQFDKIWVGTLLVNLIGCIGIFTFSKFFKTNEYDLLIKTGLLGGLTTFSTFSLELVLLYKNNNITEMFLVMFLNIFFGIILGIIILK